MQQPALFSRRLLNERSQLSLSSKYPADQAASFIPRQVVQPRLVFGINTSAVTQDLWAKTCDRRNAESKGTQSFPIKIHVTHRETSNATDSAYMHSRARPLQFLWLSRTCRLADLSPFSNNMSCICSLCPSRLYDAGRRIMPFASHIAPHLWASLSPRQPMPRILLHTLRLGDALNQSMMNPTSWNSTQQSL